MQQIFVTSPVRAVLQLDVILVDILIDLDVILVGVRIELLSITDDATDGLGGCRPSVPGPGLKIGQNTPEQIEELIGMLFLDIGELLGRGVPDDGRAACLEEPGVMCQPKEGRFGDKRDAWGALTSLADRA